MPCGLPACGPSLPQRPHRLVAVAVVADVLEGQRLGRLRYLERDADVLRLPRGQLQRLVVAWIAAAERDERRLLGRPAAAQGQAPLRQRVVVGDVADVREAHVDADQLLPG